jgi:hypothetical protein
LPEALKAGVESLSGVSLDGVKVHRNSPQPAVLQAHAYTDGSDIHIAPGEERHLPHEAWHVAQQKQGRVQPTFAAKDVALNDDAALEREADTMGAKAAAVGTGATAAAAPSVDAPAAPVVQSETKEPLSAEAQAARAEIDKLSKPQNAQGRPRRAVDIIALFKRAGTDITQAEAWNWRDTGKINPYLQAPVDPANAPSNFEPVRNQAVVDDWNRQMAEATGSDAKAGEVTTSGDGAQIKGWVDDSSGARAKTGSSAGAKRNPLHQKALEAMQAYDTIDRKMLNINLLFSDKPGDIEKVKKLRESGAYVDDKSPGEAPAHAMFVLGTSTTTATGKVVKQLVGSGIIVDNADGKWTTISANDLGARTDTALGKLKFSSRPHATIQAIGWFVPEKFPRLGAMPGEGTSGLKDAYDMKNDVKKPVLDDAAAKAEGKRFALSGHQWMGADWHGDQTYGYRMREVWDLDATGHPIKEEKKDAQGYDVFKSHQEREEVKKGVTPESIKAAQLAHEIYSGDPDKDRIANKDHFTTCIVTAGHILKKYGVDPAVFGNLMAPVHEGVKGGGGPPRNTPMFQYLKDSGAWIWGYDGFVPQQGDIFLTGTYVDTVNVKDKSHGSWTFQHVGIVANTMKNDDETYTLLSEDGGKGQSAIGEDKTGYTIRNYDPKTRLMSGASQKVMIGVWRPGILKAALLKLPPDIKATLKPQALAAYELMVSNAAKAEKAEQAAKADAKPQE